MIPTEICNGCKQDGRGTNLQCRVYGIPPSMYERMGLCPFNLPVVEKKKKGWINPLKASKRAKRGK